MRIWTVPSKSESRKAANKMRSPRSTPSTTFAKKASASGFESDAMKLTEAPPSTQSSRTSASAPTHCRPSTALSRRISITKPAYNSRDRPDRCPPSHRRQGARKLSIFHEKREEILIRDVLIANRAPARKGLFHDIDLRQNFGTRPLRGAVVVRDLPVLIELAEGRWRRCGDGLQRPGLRPQR